jgi:hypothetical protein
MQKIRDHVLDLDAHANPVDDGRYAAATGDSQGRCQSWIRLEKDCIFVIRERVQSTAACLRCHTRTGKCTLASDDPQGRCPNCVDANEECIRTASAWHNPAMSHCVQCYGSGKQCAGPADTPHRSCTDCDYKGIVCSFSGPIPNLFEAKQDRTNRDQPPRNLS